MSPFIISVNKFIFSVCLLYLIFEYVDCITFPTNADFQNVVTPKPQESPGYNFVPLHNKPYLDDEDNTKSDLSISEPSTSYPPSEFVLNLLRTVLDVVKNINKNKKKMIVMKSKSILNNTNINHDRGEGRGIYDYYDDHHDHTTTTSTTTSKPMKQSRYTDPWSGYYDFLINEGSYKFWVVFQLFTAFVLLYSCFAAIYYAKFNPITPDYDREYDDYFFGRSARSIDEQHIYYPSGFSWINTETFQFVLDAIEKSYEGYEET